MVSLSIVVIIYKIEKYLRRCVDSILEQSYKDFELILVDDGSPDACPQICDEYERKDGRVKVIHQRNQGSVRARWNGLLKTTGEYIALLDGDDWIESNMYSHMMKLATEKNVDMVVVGYKEDAVTTCIDRGNNIASGLYADEKMDEIYKKALYTGEFYEPGIIPALWNKLIRRKLFFDNYKPADSIIKMGEDAAVTYPMIARAKSIVIDNEFHPYHYCVIEGSMSRAYDERYFDRALKLFSGLKDNLITNEYMSNSLKYYTLFIVRIGIERLFSKGCGKSIREKEWILEKFWEEFKAMQLDDDVDWIGFEQRGIKIMKRFLEGRIRDVILCLYKEKVLNKVSIK